MRIKVKASVGIKTPRGGINFGNIRWFDGDKVMLSSPGDLQRGMQCELKIELNGAGGWIYTQAHVLKATDYSREQNTRAVLQLANLSERDHERLQAYLNLQQNNGRPVRRVPRGIAVAGRADPPSEIEAIPLRDPLYALSEDGRRLTVRWHDTRTYRRDWALHLAHGRLPVSCNAPKRSAFMLRLILPDGYVATFPAEIAARNEVGWRARFLIPMTLRSHMERSARTTARRAAK